MGCLSSALQLNRPDATCSRRSGAGVGPLEGMATGLQWLWIHDINNVKAWRLIGESTSLTVIFIAQAIALRGLAGLVAGPETHKPGITWAVVPTAVVLTCIASSPTRCGYRQTG